MDKKSEFKKLASRDFQAMKARGEKFTVLSAYDYNMAAMLDEAMIDLVICAFFSVGWTKKY